MAISFKGSHFPQDIILMGVRWYLAYPLSYRHVEELLEERGVPIDHATVQRWVVQYSPQLEEAFHRRKRPVWVSWRMDETYIKVKGHWYYLYRAVDKTGQTIDFLLTAQRDEEAALRFLKQTPFGRTRTLAQRISWFHHYILGSQSAACRPDTPHETWPRQPPHQ